VAFGYDAARLLAADPPVLGGVAVSRRVLRYRLAKPGLLRVTVTRLAARAGRRRAKPPKPLGAFVLRGRPGRHRVALVGRGRLRRLPRGRYSAVVRVGDTVGRRLSQRRVSFRVS
jgi:hypothetical protein